MAQQENNMNENIKKKARELGYSKFRLTSSYDIIPYDVVESGSMYQGPFEILGGPLPPRIIMNAPVNPVPVPVYVGGQGSIKLGWAPADGTGKVYPIPSTYLRCNKVSVNPPSIASWQPEEHKHWTPVIF